MENKLLGHLKEQFVDKLSKIRQISEITTQQAGLIRNEDLVSFTTSLTQRQALMDDVDKINEEIRQTEKQILEYYGMNFVTDDSITQIQTEIQSLLKGIINQDKENNVKFKQDFGTLRQKLKQLKGNKARINQAYYPKKQQQSFGYFIDRKK